MTSEQLERWNLKEVIDDSELRDKFWYLYLHKDGVYNLVATNSNFNTIIHVVDSTINDIHTTMGYSVTQANEEYDEKKQYNLRYNSEIIRFNVVPHNVGKNVFAIWDLGQSMLFATKGSLKYQQNLPKVFAELEPEPELVVPKLNYKYISINGISFKSADLRLFYNTWLYQTLVSTNAQEIELPNFSLIHLKLLKAVVTGVDPIGFISLNLSKYELAILSGPRTMLDICEMPEVESMMKRMWYNSGLPLREQLSKLPDSRNNIDQIKRLTELIRIAKE